MTSMSKIMPCFRVCKKKYFVVIIYLQQKLNKYTYHIFIGVATLFIPIAYIYAIAVIFYLT